MCENFERCGRCGDRIVDDHACTCGLNGGGGPAPAVAAAGRIIAAEFPPERTEAMLARIRQAGVSPCESCSGTGWLVGYCSSGMRHSADVVYVTRCDHCQKYPGDLQAALAFFAGPANAGWALEYVTIRKRGDGVV